MPAHKKLTPVQTLDRLIIRLERRATALKQLKLDGYAAVISELETEMDYLRRARRYLEE
jgi:hypothetical protein